MQPLDKVTVFVCRKLGVDPEVLMFKHPYAGVQFPAGTVEDGESPVDAAHREAREETGLQNPEHLSFIGTDTGRIPDGYVGVLRQTRVFARPDVRSFGWATLRHGIWVKHLREQDDFVHVQYEEWDDSIHPQYVTYNITGWVARTDITQTMRRSFFVFSCNEDTPESWAVETDNHRFVLFWSPVSDLPSIVPPQDAWVKHLKRFLQGGGIP